MNVIAPGSDVAIGQGVTARVLSVSIGANGQVQYQCAWWIGDVRYCEWLNECDVAAGGASEMRIGFVTPNARAAT